MAKKTRSTKKKQEPKQKEQKQPEKKESVSDQPVTTTKRVVQGSIVEVDYTGSFEDGSVFDTSHADVAEKAGLPKKAEYKPLVVTIGGKQVIPGFENALLDMEAGNEKDITLEPEQAYGPVNAKLILDLPKKLFQGAELKPGARVNLKMQNGMVFPALVQKIGEEKITVDLNHPLAGKKLKFSLKIVSIS